jgi:hypothetical protein
VAVVVKTGQAWLEFFVSAGETNTFEQSLVCPEGSGSSYRAVTVPALTIADLVSSLRRPDKLSVIKVDIEGAEAAALRVAGKELLSENGPLWQVEIHPGALQRFGASPHEVTEVFPADSFDRWLLPKHPYQNAPGETAPRRLPRNESFEKSIYYNLICVPKGNRWKARREELVRSLEKHAEIG